MNRTKEALEIEEQLHKKIKNMLMFLSIKAKLQRRNISKIHTCMDYFKNSIKHSTVSKK